MECYNMPKLSKDFWQVWLDEKTQINLAKYFDVTMLWVNSFSVLKYTKAIQEGLPRVIKLVIPLYSIQGWNKLYPIWQGSWACLSQRINAAVTWYLEFHWINQYTLLYNRFRSRSSLHFKFSHECFWYSD